jgi:ATP-dependent DNA helicase RecG
VAEPENHAVGHSGVLVPPSSGTPKPGAKTAIRIFHYRGKRRQTDPRTNLVKPPRTITDPVIRQIKDARDAVLEELASGIQMGLLGFEIVQKYPVRVINEAITNAVIHRDYRLPFDISSRSSPTGSK